MSVLNEVFRAGLELLLAGTYDISTKSLAVTLCANTYVSPGLDTAAITYSAAADASKVRTLNLAGQSWSYDSTKRERLLVPSANPTWTPTANETFRYGVLHDQDNLHAPFAQFTWPNDQIAQGTTFADGVTTSASPTLGSATAGFSNADIGLGVTGAGIPVGATILSVTNPTTAVLSANATATATGVSITIARSHELDLPALLRMRLWSDQSPTPLGAIERPVVLMDPSNAGWRLSANATPALVSTSTSEVDLSQAFLTSPDSTLWLLQVGLTGTVTAVNTGTYGTGDRVFSSTNPCLLPSPSPTVQRTLSVDNAGVLSVT